jgi:hypothetical protein
MLAMMSPKHFGTDPDVKVEETYPDLEIELAPIFTQDVNLKRPEDPTVSLELTRQREFDAMLISGKYQAEITLMGAGFLGGSSKGVIALWFFCALIGSIGLFNPFLFEIENNETRLVFFFMRLFFCNAIVGCILRGRFLLRRKYQYAYYTLVTFIPIGALLNVLWQISRLKVIVNPDEMRYDCGDPEAGYCGGSILRIASIIHGMHIICNVSSSGLALLMSFELSEQKIGSASDTMRKLTLLISFANVFSVIHFFILRNVSTTLYCLASGILFFCSYVYLWQRRVRLKQMANAIVDDDRKKYDATWANEVLGVQAHIETFQKLTSVLEKCTDVSKKNKIVASSVEAVKEASFAGNTTRPRQTIADLVVLFAHAKSVNPHFQKCVKSWAQGISGAHAKNIPIKRRKRAIQKLFRSYAGNASRLIDLVRSSITFDTPDGLVQCLERVSTDPHVAILEYKNRFDPSFDSQLSAGYRNVALSLLLVDDTSMQIGADTHIIELQMSLSCIEKIKNDDGHRRYVKWRDLLGE